MTTIISMFLTIVLAGQPGDWVQEFQDARTAGTSDTALRYQDALTAVAEATSACLDLAQEDQAACLESPAMAALRQRQLDIGKEVYLETFGAPWSGNDGELEALLDKDTSVITLLRECRAAAVELCGKGQVKYVKFAYTQDSEGTSTTCDFECKDVAPAPIP